jgi:type I restriction enzyme S subunit
MGTETATPMLNTPPELPAGWRWVRLGDVCEISARQVDPKNPEFGVLPHVNGENIEGGNCRLLYLRTAAEEGMTSGKYLFEAGDVLYSKLRPYLRKAVVVDFRGVCSADMYPIRVNRAVLDPHFAVWMLVTDEFTRYAERESARARMPKLNREQLFAWHAPLPPLSEQKRIASVLQDQMAVVERARAAAETRLEAAKMLPAVYLRSVFENDMIAECSSARLGEIAKLLPSKSISTTGDAEVRAITTACLSERGFLPAGVKQALMWRADAEECKVTAGEVLIARSNTPELVGRVSMYDGDPPDVVASDLTIRIWPSDGVTSPFLAKYLSYLYLTDYWKKRSGGTSGSMKKITREQIKALMIPIPPAETQDSICNTLAQQMHSVACLRAAIEVEMAAIESLTPAFLRRAFQGRL